MDDIVLPDEGAADVPIHRAPISSPSGVQVAHQEPPASPLVKVTFGRFVNLVANHSFSDVVAENEDEEIIISANLLTDLANSRRFVPNTKEPLLLIGGVLLGIFLAYFIFSS